MGSLDEDPVFELVEEKTPTRVETEEDLDAQDGTDRKAE